MQNIKNIFIMKFIYKKKYAIFYSDKLSKFWYHLPNRGIIDFHCLKFCSAMSHWTGWNIFSTVIIFSKRECRPWICWIQDQQYLTTKQTFIVMTFKTITDQYYAKKVDYEIKWNVWKKKLFDPKLLLIFIYVTFIHKLFKVV